MAFVGQTRACRDGNCPSVLIAKKFAATFQVLSRRRHRFRCSIEPVNGEFVLQTLDFLLDGGLCGEVERDACGAVRVGRVADWGHVHQGTREGTRRAVGEGESQSHKILKIPASVPESEEFWFA